MRAGCGTASFLLDLGAGCTSSGESAEGAEAAEEERNGRHATCFERLPCVNDARNADGDEGETGGEAERTGSGHAMLNHDGSPRTRR